MNRIVSHLSIVILKMVLFWLIIFILISHKLLSPSLIKDEWEQWWIIKSASSKWDADPLIGWWKIQAESRYPSIYKYVSSNHIIGSNNEPFATY